MPSKFDIRVVDSSLLIEADIRKVMKPLDAYLRTPKSVAPPRVLEETVTEPRQFAHFRASASRIQSLFDNGAVEVEEPDYSDGRTSKAVDKIRDCMASKMGKMGHLVELADLQVAALAISHVLQDERVEVISLDEPLKGCMEAVLPPMGILLPTMTDAASLVRSFRR